MKTKKIQDIRIQLGHGIKNLNKEMEKEGYIPQVEHDDIIDVFLEAVDIYEKTLKKEDHIFIPQLVIPFAFNRNAVFVQFYKSEEDRYYKRNEIPSTSTETIIYYQSPTIIIDRHETKTTALKKLFKLFDRSYTYVDLSPNATTQEKLRIDLDVARTEYDKKETKRMAIMAKTLVDAFENQKTENKKKNKVKKTNN